MVLVDGCMETANSSAVVYVARYECFQFLENLFILRKIQNIKTFVLRHNAI